MCILCYALAGEEHWTDARVGSEPHASVRARRRGMVTEIMAAHGLDYSDDPSGVTALISDRLRDCHREALAGLARDLGIEPPDCASRRRLGRSAGFD